MPPPSKSPARRQRSEPATPRPPTTFERITAPRRRVPVAPPIERNIVIVHQPGWQALDDWREIAENIRRIDPTTGVIVVSNDIDGEQAAAHAAKLPSVVVSPGPLGKFTPQRGKVYHGNLMWKFDELRLLAAAGVPVPRTMVLAPDTVLDPAQWGEFVIIKPSVASSMGNGVQLIRPARVRYKAPDEYPAGHAGRNGPMIIQEFINCGERINIFRVLTLFGEPLFCMHVTARDKRVELTADDEAIEAGGVTTQAYEARDRMFEYDADVVALARRAHFAMPDIPLKGVDVIREVETGRLFVLEVNPRCNAWQFSSKLAAHGTANVGPPPAAYKAQLDAFVTAAYVLADVARQQAV